MSVIIDGVNYPVKIIDLKQSADVIDKFAERTESGTLSHEVLGVYYNFDVQFDCIEDPALHERFYNDLTAPKNSRIVTLPGTYTTYTFKCYIRVQPVSMRRHKSTGNIYDGLQVKFIAISPARRP